MTDIVKSHRIQREENEGPKIEVGQWYQVRERDGKKRIKWMGCVTHVGSNFAALRGVGDHYGSYYTARFHFDEFFEHCVPEPNAELIIQNNVEKYQRQVQELMEDVKLLTSQLSLDPRSQLSDGGETQALSVRSSDQSIEDYKTSLVKAKEKTLPEIFDKIKKANECMAEWMKAPLIPLKAAADGLQGIVKVIENRIFNVELYAGLIEEVVQIKDGQPASIETPVHLFQRRAYMDEECLARYESGGMDFKDIEDFDKWIVKSENLERLLPHQRSVLAFRIRRFTKERNATNISQFIKFWYEQQADKLTFLYIRNGEQVFRLSTGIEFGSQLFPDVERSKLDGKVYAKMFGNSVQNIIGESEYQGLKEDYAKKRIEVARKLRQLRKKKVPKNEFWRHVGSVFSYAPSERDFHGEYIEWSPTNVYYDEITEFVQAQIDKHNRLVIVLQGLFDRSPVFHPHPPYQLWTYDGFNQAVKLIYDDSRGLVTGDAPDFEAYRTKLNKSIKTGTLTVGQQDAWLREEARKENNRRANDYRWNSYDRDLKTFHPYGNPGPGDITKVERVSKKRGLIYKWTRERQGYRYRGSGEINCWFVTEPANVLNVDAYTPGDFKIFFEDPRTRANYLQWAPLLLAAEDHYGKKKGKKK